jgi:hypothetical protein
MKILVAMYTEALLAKLIAGCRAVYRLRYFTV